MNKTFAAAHALIEFNGKYLILKRAESDDYQPGLWDIPGGTIEFGEIAEMALQRELMEETKISVENMGVIYVYTNNSQLPNRQTFQIVYKCKLRGNDSINLNEEHSEYKWVKYDDIKKYNCISFLKALTQNYVADK